MPARNCSAIPVIGLLGGIGPASTRLYYDLLTKRGRARLGTTPEIIVHSLDFDRFTRLENTSRDGYVREIRRGLDVLLGAGATVLAMAANSPHAVFEDVTRDLAHVPVSLVDAVVEEVVRAGLRRPLLLGIPFTLRQPFYPDSLRLQGIEVVVPDPSYDALLHRVIFEELTHDVVSDRSRADLLDLIDAHHIDGVILGCTELGLMLQPAHTAVRLLDTAQLHVDAILDHVCVQALTPTTEVSRAL